MRDDFTKPVVETLAKRVGSRCSNPGCRKMTSGPHSEDDKSLNVGVAAHITAASSGGPRYDALLTPKQRKAIGNGIWLCQSCSKLIDNDETRYTTATLQLWKANAEQEALKEIETLSEQGKLSDIDALKEYSAQFDRAALQDSLRGCGDYKLFAKSLGELIELLNTGLIQGKAATKRRSDFANDKWRSALGDVYHEVRGLRELYTSLVRSGEIDESSCTCKFRNHKMYDEFEAKKRSIVLILNDLLRDANLPAIRGVS